MLNLTPPKHPCGDCNADLRVETVNEIIHWTVFHDDTCPWYRAHLNRAQRRAERKAQR